MEKFSKEIKLMGISNSNVADICEDGECCDIVNMHNKNGVWCVSGMPEKVIEGDNSNRICRFIHCNNDFSHLISYDGENVFWEANISEGKTEPIMKPIAKIENIISFEAMGNILISVCKDGNEFSLFNKDTYSHIGKVETPILNFYLKSLLEKSNVIYGFTLPNAAMDDSLYKYENYKFMAEKFYNECVLKMANDANYSKTFNSPFLVRYAIRLFDGSYIKPSAPILMLPEKNFKEHFRQNISIEKTDSGYITSPIITYYKNYYLHFNADALPSSEWDNIISSIDIFISNPLFIATENFNNVTEHDFTKESNNSSFTVELEFPRLTDDKIKDKLLNESLFYKIASFSLSELRNEETFAKAIMPPVSIESLPSLETLPVDNFSHYNFTGDVTFLYNSRFHIGNIRRYLPQTFNPAHFIVAQNVINGYNAENNFKNATSCHIKILVKSTTGDKFIEMDTPLSKEGVLTPYISYPDSRASQIEIWVKYNDGSKQYASLPLTASKVENMAYYINDDYKSISLNTFEGEVPTERRFDFDYFPNLLRVSNSENPFYFPQELSYTVSNGEILNIATVTTELSQGRYGDFPLYIFTSDGIWALQLGDGEVIYKSLIPVSRDIALSKNSIVNTDNNIIFLSKKGLMVVNGSNVAQLSTFGLERSDIINEIEVEGKNFNIKSEQAVIDNFKKYISNSHIEYNYNKNELLFLKEGINYLYSLSLNSGVWNRVAFSSIGMLSFLKRYPQLFVSDEIGNLYNISNEVKDVSMPFTFTTRAIKGSNNYMFKHLKEVNLKGELDRIDKNMCIEVLASNFPDRDFKPIAKVLLKESYRDGVKIPIYAPAYKYFRISGYGNAKCGMNINNIIMTFHAKYNSRLR
ncbi:MAG: hypothetical protein J6R61_02630 [Bacteroidales bacterium]|nr:hypothetical protein [Bacteroidales bacterium]